MYFASHRFGPILRLTASSAPAISFRRHLWPPSSVAGDLGGSRQSMVAIRFVFLQLLVFPILITVVMVFVVIVIVIVITVVIATVFILVL